jgi:membrane-associated phospholipid phosphatase
VAALGTAYLAGSATHNDHLRETGLLAGEAMLDATIVGTVLKYATNRERPDTGNGQGDFWPHGTRDATAGQSFPSGHAIGVWAFAHVVADEYPGFATKLAVYGLAAGVSASRVMGREHFPTDALVGSVFGYLIGGYVYNHHSGSSQYSFSIAPVMEKGAAGVSLQFH